MLHFKLVLEEILKMTMHFYNYQKEENNNLSCKNQEVFYYQHEFFCNFFHHIAFLIYLQIQYHFHYFELDHYFNVAVSKKNHFHLIKIQMVFRHRNLPNGNHLFPIKAVKDSHYLQKVQISLKDAEILCLEYLLNVNKEKDNFDYNNNTASQD